MSFRKINSEYNIVLFMNNKIICIVSNQVLYTVFTLHLLKKIRHHFVAYYYIVLNDVLYSKMYFNKKISQKLVELIPIVVKGSSVSSDVCFLRFFCSRK